MCVIFFKKSIFRLTSYPGKVRVAKEVFLKPPYAMVPTFLKSTKKYYDTIIIPVSSSVSSTMVQHI